MFSNTVSDVPDFEKQTRREYSCGFQAMQDSQYEIAISYFEKVVHIRDEANSKMSNGIRDAWKANAVLHIGLCYVKLSKLKTAITYYQKAAGLEEPDDDGKRSPRLERIEGYQATAENLLRTVPLCKMS